MSKKTRKKSAKTPSRPKPAKARVAKSLKTAAKKAASKSAGKKKSSAKKTAQKGAVQRKPATRKKAGPSRSRKVPKLTEGSLAPSFHLPRDGGGSISPADYPGKKLVLFFYPRADTPGCTRESIDFSRLKSAFASANTIVIGVSADAVADQDAFRDKHQLTVPLISDAKHDLLEKFGVWGEKSLYGRTFMGIVRTTVLIDSDGRIGRIWRNVRVDGHADEVLAAAQSQ